MSSSHPRDPDTPSDDASAKLSPGDQARSGGRDFALTGKALLVVAALAAGLVALAAWGLGESGVFRFRPAIANLNMMGHEYQDASPQTRETAMLKEASCLLGFLGASLGAVMGLLGGLAGRSPRRVLIGAGLGLVVGALAGAVPLWVVIPVYNRAEELTAGGIVRSLFLHWGMWIPVGAAAGVAFGAGLGARSKVVAGLLGGILGVVLGTIAYELLGGILFPLAETGRAFADLATARLMAMLFAGIAPALGAVFAATSAVKSRPKTA